MASVERCTVLITLVLVVHCGEHIVNGVISDVRLVDGPTSNKGTVEIRQDNGSWETTCGVNLGINDVIVICRQLGFTGASRAITNTTYGQSSTPTRGLTCSGDEDNLAECTLFSNAACSIAGAASCHGDGYIGCFKDDERDRVLPGLQLASSLMSISFCIKYCNESTRANYTYAGLEHGYACYCHSGEASDDFARHGEVSDANCQIPCLGDPTDSCGGSLYIAVFRLFQSTPPSTTVAETSPAIATTDTTTTTTSTPSSFASTSGQLDVNTVFQSTPPPTSVADTSSTFASSSGQVDVKTVFQSTPPPTTVADTSSTFASTSGQLDVKTVFQSTPPPTTSADTSSTFASTSGQVDLKTEIASTLAVGILLAFVTLYGIIITLMYLHLRRSKIALKPSVSDREGQELDPYTSLDTTTMKQPAYEDIKATRQGNRGYTNAIEGVEYGNQRIVEQTARVKKSNLGVADENTEPEYELPM